MEMEAETGVARLRAKMPGWLTASGAGRGLEQPLPCAWRTGPCCPRCLTSGLHPWERIHLPCPKPPGVYLVIRASSPLKALHSNPTTLLGELMSTTASQPKTFDPFCHPHQGAPRLATPAKLASMTMSSTRAGPSVPSKDKALWPCGTLLE